MSLLSLVLNSCKNSKIKFISILFSLVFFGLPFKAFSVDYHSYLEDLVIIQTSMDTQQLFETIAKVKKTQTVEAYEVISKRLEEFLDSKYLSPTDSDTRAQYVSIILGLADGLVSLGTRHDVSLFDELLYIIKMSLSDGVGVLADEDLYQSLKQLQAQLRNKQHFKSFVKLESLPGFQAEVHKGDNLSARLHKRTLESVNGFFESMKKEVEGQDDILRAFEILYLKDLKNNGERTAPEVFYLMGLPGNGKDTVVEAYVKTLWPANSEALEKHLFRMNIRNKGEAWSYFGSSKGYIGSEEFPDFLKFLVDHSAGKYVLTQAQEGGKVRTVVEKNPNWMPEDGVLGASPNRAVIFVNEAHNIPKEVKDNILKQAIERGIFPVTNPGTTENSVSTIELPVTFIFATNEGIELLEPREKNGSRSGLPLSYEQLIENYERVAADKSALKQAILKNNGEKNNPVGADAAGTSEEFLNRIPDHRVLMLKPLSPAVLKRLAKLRIKKIQSEFGASKGNLGSYKVSVSDRMIDFLTDYKYIASENARPINSRVDNFISSPIYDALLKKKIRPLGVVQNIEIDLVEYKNGVKSVVFKVSIDGTDEVYQFHRIIKETLSDRKLKPLSAERIKEISKMREQILENVFGVEHIVDHLIEAAIVSESEARNDGVSDRPATVMAFLGKSSTGKTETAKQYVKARYGAKELPVVIDFNLIKTVEDLQAKIIGGIDGRKNPIASDFMKAYDRANGNIAFIFDEAANAPKELLKALYEILRESVVTGFSDGKPRPMKNVTIIITGNAGEKIYENIPTDLPTEVYERALHEVFKIFISNEDRQKRILLETFPEAFLARLGQNIYHFGPLTHAGKRQVAQLKLLKGISSLKAKQSEIGWDIAFQDESTLLRLFKMIEKEGFDHSYQGASIDKFVRESIIDKIKARLLIEGVKSGELVTLELDPAFVEKEDRDTTSIFRKLILHTESGQSFNIEIPLGQKKTSMKKSNVDRVLTAYHEVGHELVSEVYFGDRIRPKFMSIIEGVTVINDLFVHYAGLRVGEYGEATENTKGAILRRAAVLAGGYVAQSLVTLGGRHDSGKSNDISRTTYFIRNSILRFGLSEQWGMSGIPEDVSIDDYVSKSLSNADKALLKKITSEWLLEAERMAREALMLNAEFLLLHMSKALATSGYLKAVDILDLYKQHHVITERDGEVYTKSVEDIRKVKLMIDEALKIKNKKFQAKYHAGNFKIENAAEAFNYLLKGWTNFYTNPWEKLNEMQKFTAAIYLASKVLDDSRDAKLSSPVWMPEHVANIDRIILDEVSRATVPVTQLERFKILSPMAETENVEITDPLLENKPLDLTAPVATLESPSVLMGSANSCSAYLN
jgi:hypothetical protein